MAGRLYGVGVGPGDPELLTMKGLRLIYEADVIAAPGREVQKSVAYRIAAQAVALAGKKAQNIFAEKELLSVPMPMEKDEAELAKAHNKGIESIRKYLDKEKMVVFLTLGDPTIYSTYLYLHKRLTEDGYFTELVSGVPSFCSAAARLNMGLVERAEALHVIPASYSLEISEGLERSIRLPGTKVLMKSGKCMKDVKEKLIEEEADIYMIENCGMEEEKVYTSAGQIPDNSSYYSLIIMKDRMKSE